MSKLYEIHTIIHFNDYELEGWPQEALENTDFDGMFDYCKQWDSGGESEHSPDFNSKTPNPAHYDSEDRPCDKEWSYTLTASSSFGDMTLYRWRQICAECRDNPVENTDDEICPICFEE
jgi:hypothetical protein